MTKIFISYRRAASSGDARLLYERLASVFGDKNVFLDTETIPASATFESYILSRIDKCNVFIAVLAEGTFDRIHNDDDWVRREIAFALNKPDVHVIPLLVDGFRMPAPADLPVDVRAITGLNARFLYHHMFDESSQNLIRSIREISSEPAIQTHGNRGILIMAVLVLIAIVAVALFLLMGNGDDGDNTAQVPPSEIPTVTETPSPTPTETTVYTSTPTRTPTELPSMTPSDISTATQTFTVTATLTATVSVTNTPGASANAESVETGFPCDATIQFGTGGSLNQVYVQPLENAPKRPPVQRGADVNVLDSVSDFGINWYSIRYGQDKSEGWIKEEYIILSVTCPKE